MFCKFQICLFVLFIFADWCTANNRVQVDVYYESLCPDSKKFIVDQLYPSLQTNISKYVNVTLVPYGLTTETNGQLTCHHGNEECRGNRLHACALHDIHQNQNVLQEGYNKIALAFISCLMEKSNYDKSSILSCATKTNVERVNNIENCIDHTDSEMYIREYGRKTNMLQKPLKSVPTVVFNSKYSTDDSNLAQKNFIKSVCQYIQGEKPAECEKNSAVNLSKVSVAFVAMATAALMFV